MQSSQSSSSESNSDRTTGHKRLIQCVTWILRALVGGVFIFSGFVKAIDPWGTLYKVEEYLSVMGIGLWHSIVIAGVFMLCAFEFTIGVFLALGCYRRSTPWLAFITMCFMLPLTLWIAVSNPVADCGCFGDAVLISNWGTFWKNVALMVGVIWLIKFNMRCPCIIAPALQWVAFLCTMLFLGSIEMTGYLQQPLLDFRPYKTGLALIPEGHDEDEGSFIFIYEKDGVRKEFTETDTLPSEDEGWKFVERRDIIPVRDNGDKVEDSGSDRTIRLWDKSGAEDLTEEAVPEEGDMLLLMMPDLAEVTPAMTWKLNSLYDWSRDHDAEMSAVVAGTPQEVSEWEDIAIPEYEVYTSDDTSIKEVARGNPAVVFLRDGKVVWKRTLSSVDVDDFMAPDIDPNPMNYAPDGIYNLYRRIWLYAVVLILLAVVSQMPKLLSKVEQKGKDIVSKGRQLVGKTQKDKIIRDDKAHREE